MKRQEDFRFNDERESPQQPSTPKPSLSSAKKFLSYAKNNQFKSYNPARPPLLVEINEMVEKGMQKINFLNESSFIVKLEVYKQPFQRLIDDFNIYGPFLYSVKHAYESAINQIESELRKYSIIDSHMAVIEQESSFKVLRAQYKSELSIKNLEETVVELKNKLEVSSNQNKLLEFEMKSIANESQLLRKECDELRSTCLILTNSLTRLEEEKKKLQFSETSMQNELSGVKLLELKQSELIDRSKS
jgi:hypothetical protein